MTEDGNGMETCSGSFEFQLNGQTVTVAGVSPNVTLLDFLRARGARGTKEGCAEGDCGACSVALVERDATGKPCYRSINSCLALLPMVAGREILTVEGVKSLAGGNGDLHPVQQTMVDRHGSQCGYCTPGFIMSMVEGYYRDDLTERWQISDQLCGNLCRCTGYRPIADAAACAFRARAEGGEHNAEGGRRKAEGFEGAGVPLMISESKYADAPAFAYTAGEQRFHQPGTLEELLALRAQHPGAALLAGATELGLDVNKKFSRFDTIVSLAGVRELQEIQPLPDGGWSLGAGAPLTRIEEVLRAANPDILPNTPEAVILKMLWVFGARQIRNRATLGGNIANASPIGDLAPVLLALDAEVVLRSRADGERVVPLDEFFTGYRRTALRPGEILCAVRVPFAKGRANDSRLLLDCFKVSRRREMDISIVSAAFCVDLDAEGIVQHARLAYGGVAATTLRARAMEAALLGQPWTEETLARVLPVLAGEFKPINDVRASAAYRRGLITSLFEKYFELDGTPELPLLDRRPIAQPPPLLSDKPIPHESARGHVTGAACYVDDQPARGGMLDTWPVCAPHARAKILRRDATAARAMPGIAAVLLAEDVPGENEVGAVRKDEILLADKEVFFHGQLVAMVVGESREACRLAAEKIQVEYEPLPPILDVADAIAAENFHTMPHCIRRGDAAAEFARLASSGADAAVITGEFRFGGQEHFYLEGQAAWAEPGEDGEMFIHSSTQHPSEIQAVVSHVLHLPRHKITVQSPRMGGGFGGKETQGNTWAALAALGALRTGRPVRVRLNRDQDMILTGKRHPFLARYSAGFEPDGTLRALRVDLYSDGGWALDLSTAITDRAILHLDNAYYIPNVDLSSRVCKTNLVSNTAFRGFGGPQGMLVIEEIMDGVARHLGLPPEQVRERNLYHGSGETNTTHYGQEIGDNRVRRVWRELKASSNFEDRRREVTAWNAEQPHAKRGLALTPVKFGISFTISHLNQAGAHVLIYQDGSVQVNHGGTEMGQGLHTKMLTAAARELGVAPSAIRMMKTRTDQVPNTSPTAASSGSDLNGQAVKAACVVLRERMAPVAVELLGEPDVLTSAGELIFAGGRVFHPARPERSVAIEEVVFKSYLARVSLAATGFYATPGIQYDRDKGRGKPFFYYANGAAVSEVEVDGFTGACRLRRVDILHDVGRSLHEAVDRGQIEGGFIQGMGWLTCEELRWDKEGRLVTHAPSTYKIPAFGDTPVDFRINLLTDAAEEKVIGGSKAVGEPPLMLAISVREAIRDAVGAFGQESGGGSAGRVELPSPATGEAIFLAVRARQEAADEIRRGVDLERPAKAGVLEMAC